MASKLLLDSLLVAEFLILLKKVKGSGQLAL